jgi:hypothetical protein
MSVAQAREWLIPAAIVAVAVVAVSMAGNIGTHTATRLRGHRPGTDGSARTKASATEGRTASARASIRNGCPARADTSTGRE